MGGRALAGWALAGWFLLAACTPLPTPQLEANLREQTLTDAWSKLAQFAEVDPALPLTGGWEMLIEGVEFRHFFLSFAAATAQGEWAMVDVTYVTAPQSRGSIGGFPLTDTPDPAYYVPVARVMQAVDEAGGLLALAPPGAGHKLARLTVDQGEATYRSSAELHVFTVNGATVTRVPDGETVTVQGRRVMLTISPLGSGEAPAGPYVPSATTPPARAAANLYLLTALR